MHRGMKSLRPNGEFRHFFFLSLFGLNEWPVQAGPGTPTQVAWTEGAQRNLSPNRFNWRSQHSQVLIRGVVESFCRGAILRYLAMDEPLGKREEERCLDGTEVRAPRIAQPLGGRRILLLTN